MKIKDVSTAGGLNFRHEGFFVGKDINITLRVQSDGESWNPARYKNPMNLYFDNVEVDKLED